MRKNISTPRACWVFPQSPTASGEYYFAGDQRERALPFLSIRDDARRLRRCFGGYQFYRRIVAYHIHYAVVLAYMPGQLIEYMDFSDTMLPEGIEGIHPRFAISWRNNWMLRKADYVVTYVTHTWGGAHRFACLARRNGKYVINIA